ncbi:hypothetical protein [Brevibacterium album]|uniref:hypothetical protein n=1 Tax=Brevibacterium album TaxID=417948 RepID=UPI000429510D|nr:hypothetical protein [Brevibacterium album]
MPAPSGSPFAWAGPASASQAGRDRPVTAHDGTPIAASDPGTAGFWYGPDAVLRYRGTDGLEYFLRDDLHYLPLSALTAADLQAAAAAGVPFASAAPPGAPPHPGQSPSAADDHSTYYEYIAHHSGRTPTVPSAGPRTGQGGGAAGAGSVPGGGSDDGAFGTAGTGPHGAAGLSAQPYGSGEQGPGKYGPQPYGQYGAQTHAAAPGSDAHAPQERRARRRGVVWGLVGFGLVVVVAAALGLVLGSPGGGMQATELDPPAAEETEKSSDSPRPEPSEGGGSTAPAPPAEQLDAHVAEGTRIAEAELAETWVVQLSAKKPGLETSGQTWTEAAILAEFEENRRRYPEAVMLWSGDWQSFKMGDYWITVLAEPYDSPEDALAKCTSLGIDRDNCYAKKLSTVEGPEDTTRLND